MTSRFNLTPILRGHWRGLTFGESDNLRPDWLARAVFVVVPVGIFAASLWRGWEVRSPSPLLAGVSLLAGALVSAFTYLSNLRMKVAEWIESDPTGEKWVVERDMLDETASHLLMAATLCATEAVLIVAGLNLRSAKEEIVSGPLGALCLAVGSYIFLLFILCLPRLYSAYVELGNVGGLSGFTKNRRRKRT